MKGVYSQKLTGSAMLLSLILSLCLSIAGSTGRIVQASPAYALPTSVTVAGSLQSELGCPGDWQPNCAVTQMTAGTDQVFRFSGNLPTGSYEYKAALNKSWDENYGLHAALNGANIALNISGPQSVKFYYDPQSHWITDNQRAVIATAVGSFQSEIGCPGDWQPDCLKSWLQDPDGDGIYTYETTQIPAGNYELKVALYENWDVNYGQGGAPGGANILFTVAAAGTKVKITFNAATHAVTVNTGQSAHDNNVEYAGLGHNSQDLVYRQPFGAVNPGTQITLRFRTFYNDATGVKVRVYNTATSGEFMQNMTPAATDVSCMDDKIINKTCDFWETKITPQQLTTLYYRFIITDGTSTAYYADDKFKDGAWGESTSDLVDNSYVITVFDPAFKPIPWMQDGVIYQIFPDRFRNGRKNNDPSVNEPRYSYPPNPLDQIINKQWNDLPEGYCRDYVNPATACSEAPRGRDYFGGDLKGVDQSLEYLKSVGVTIIYFNPIFDAGSNHAYDTQNYFAIDPFFGTQKDWANLNKHADTLGMRVVLDGVFNHVSSDSKYFDRYGHYSEVGACESVNSPYRSWFYFQDQPGGPCAGPNGPNTMNYTGWFGFDSIPVLNKNVQAVRDLIYAKGTSSVGPYWLQQGADGWRLDVMGDGSFPDDFWQQFRTAIKAAKADAPIIGELWKKEEVLPKIHGDMADTTMNYRYRNAILGYFGTVDNKGFVDDGQSNEVPSLFARKLNSVREDYPDATYYTLMNLLDSHDTKRILWSLTPGENNREQKEFNAANLQVGKQRLRLATIVQFTVPGTPTIYYGDEVGVTGADDPDDRRTFPWNGDNPGGDATLLAHYQKLTAIRAANPVLRNGSLKFLLTDDTTRAMAYGMRKGDNLAIIAVNPSATASTLNIPLSNYLRNGVTFSDALGGAGATSSGGKLTLTLPAYGGVILLPNSGQDLTPPSAPTNLLAVAGNKTVSLSWNAVAGAAGYNVYRSPLSGGGYQLIATTTAPAYVDNNVTNSKEYFYVVTALDGPGNESGWSNQASALPYAPIGWAGNLWPKTLTITIDATKSYTFYAQVYAAGVTDASGQGQNVVAQFAYGPAGSDPATWNWLPMVYNTDVGNNDEYKIDITPEMVGSFDYVARFSTNLGRNWTYAKTEDGLPGRLTVNASADTTAPAAPTNLTGIGSAAQIKLQWNASPEADLFRYEVWRKGPGDASFRKLANLVKDPAPSYTDTTVTSGQTYSYVVTAQDTSFNRSANSNTATIKAEVKLVAVTFKVTLPATTPAGDSIYVAGSFPAPYPTWDPGGIKMTRSGLTAEVTLNLLEGTRLEYKYTRGGWDKVEKDANCAEIANRQLTVSYGANGQQTVQDTVAKWVDVDHC